MATARPRKKPYDLRAGVEPARALLFFGRLHASREERAELMRRHRASRRNDAALERVQRGIHISINGLAAGLRNTG